MKSKNNFPLVSIVIPTKDRETKLQRLLKSLDVLTYPKNKIEIIVINNGSEFKSILNNVKIIQNNNNTGLANARNQGAELAKGKYVLFIDDDNVVDKNMLSIMVKICEENEEISALGPLTYYLSSPQKIWFAGARMNLWTSKPYFYTSEDIKMSKVKDLFVVDSLHNCFIVKKSLGDKVKWFDKDIFMNGTEYDLVQRMKRIDEIGKCGVALKAKCFHDVPTFSEDLMRSLGFENPLRAYYFQRNRGVFLKRYGTFFQKITVGLFFYPLFFLFYSVLFIYKGRWNLFFQQIRGTISGYYYMFRPL